MTAQEQLDQVRVAYIKNLYKGQPEAVITAATKHVHRMEFSSHEEFEQFAIESFQNDPGRQATEDELDIIMDHMGLPDTESDHRSIEDKNLDEIMKYL